MLEPDLRSFSPALSLNELQELMSGNFGPHQAGSFFALISLLRNTEQTPATQMSPLQVVQQKLQAQYEATPLDDAPENAPTRQQLQCVMEAIACYERQKSELPELLLASESLQAYDSARQAVGLSSDDSARSTPISEVSSTYEKIISAMPVTPTQRYHAFSAVAQLKPLLERHSIFTASPQQRENLLLHFHTLIRCELQPSLPITRSPLAFEAFFDGDNSGDCSRLECLQLMTACLRGSPKAEIAGEITALLSSKLTEEITFAQILVPRAANNMSDSALFSAFSHLTPAAQQLFLAKLSHAALKICQLITVELAQSRRDAQTSPPLSASASRAQSISSDSAERAAENPKPDSEDEFPTPSSEQTFSTESNIDQPSPIPSPSIAEAETVTSRGAEVSPEQQQLTQKCYQKLRKAYQLNGPLTELGRITLLQAPNSVQIDSNRALLMLNYGIALLTRLSGYMPYLPQEDVKLAATIRITFALVLNAKMLREMSAAASKSPSSATPPPTLPPMSSSARYLHYYTICAYLKHRTQPWNVDALYQDVTELLRHFEPKESEQSQVTNVPLTTFMLDDVPLNPEVELPASYSRAALGASSTQSPEELLAIYKERCLQYHPDQNPHQKELAQKRFLRLQIVGASLKLKL